MMQVFVLSVQNSVGRAAMGSATALTHFARSIGATLGVAVMGLIVNQGLPRGLEGKGASVHRLPPAAREALADALHPAFVAATFVAVLVWAIAFVGVKEVPLRRGVDDPADAAVESSGAPG